MTILAVDTTSELGSVAVRRNGRTITEIEVAAPGGYGQVIFGALAKQLQEISLKLEEVDCFAAASGPGSFTGVRVGLTLSKGLAEALGKRVAGISNLRALSTFGSSDAALRAVALDARRGQMYAAVYDRELQAVAPETVLTLAAWLETLDPGRQYEFLSAMQLDFTGTRFEGAAVTSAPRSLAAGVALCAERDGEARWMDPADLDANYVRRSDAELFWRDGV